jgi:hypothetical protein
VIHDKGAWHRILRSFPVNNVSGLSKGERLIN